MPRDIPVGNGQMLVTYDDKYQIRDIYYPHVGQENHVADGGCRFGAWTDVPGSSGKTHRLAWSYEGWNLHLAYEPGTLVTRVTMEHPELRIRLICRETVDFHRPILIRQVTVVNLEDTHREVRLFHNNHFHVFGTNVGNTSYFDPKLRMIVHYHTQRYLMAGFFADSEARMDSYATGVSGFHGAEGTWRDAEDGVLGCNPIAQGAVDSTMGLHVQLPPKSEHEGKRTIYMFIGCGKNRDDLAELHAFIYRVKPHNIMGRTSAYWRLWEAAGNLRFGNLPDRVVRLFRRSLLVVRTQIDNSGAIIAANDSDIMQYSRDTYSYLWPRDGALVAYSLDAAGYQDVARSFYSLCSKIIAPEGYFYHKYNPDGSPASSWHPWVSDERPQLPIQEDETSLVIWALWQHYYRFRDIEFVRPLWVRLIKAAADFLVRFRAPVLGLPLPSYDLWEERWGIHTFTVATVYGALVAARNFAVCFGDIERADRYNEAAKEMRAGFIKYMWSEESGRFLRRIVPRDTARISHLTELAVAGRDPSDSRVSLGAYDDRDTDIQAAEDLELDDVIDSAMYSIFKFGLLDVDDPRVEKTMTAIEERLWVKTEVGGSARYETDYYHRVSEDVDQIPGNPWIICTLWLADWHIAKAKNTEQLKDALRFLEWAVDHTLPSGVLAEQVHPHTGEPLSVSPLTWSHATVVSTVVEYLQKLEQLQRCHTCYQPLFRLQRTMQSHTVPKTMERPEDLGFATDECCDGYTAGMGIEDAEGRLSVVIEPDDCIGCEICVNKCEPRILEMVNGKAMIKVDMFSKCTACRHCEDFCPTDVITVEESDGHETMWGM